MKFTPSIVLYVWIALCALSCKQAPKVSTPVPFKEHLEQLFPNASIDSLEAKDHFTEAYQIVLKQPLDHNNPNAGTFDHYIYLSHIDFDQPTVLITEGYSVGSKKERTNEVSQILKANQVRVEYRFYGDSRPESIPWKYLTYDQSIADYHSIVSKLKKLYNNKWISTGISKGGETTMIYKAKYPNDMDVAVPYVAPLINTQEDPRTQEHINTVGTEECRNKVTKFQRLLLTHRTQLLEQIAAHAEENDMKFTKVSPEEALEYAALEFPFSFWQWGGKCDEIPDESADPKTLFSYMDAIVGISFYSDATFYRLLPSYYQHMTELGYYGFDTTPVKDLLQVVKNPTNMRFAPDVPMIYNKEYIKNVRDFVENKGNHILSIYGEYDTWSACAPTPKPNVNALKMVLKEGSHETRIKHFSQEDRQKIYNKLQEWLGNSVAIHPLP